MSKRRMVALLISGVLVGLLFTPIPAQAGLTISQIWRGIMPKADARYVKQTAVAPAPTSQALISFMGGAGSNNTEGKGLLGNGYVTGVSCAGESAMKVQVVQQVGTVLWNGSCTEAEKGKVIGLPSVAYTGFIHATFLSCELADCRSSGFIIYGYEIS